MIVSIDLETLDTAPTAIIAAIGISVMSEDGNFVDGFKTKIDLNQPGRSVSSSTMCFWLNQDFAAQDLTFATTDDEASNLPTLTDALVQMSTFLRKYSQYAEYRVWGNPSTFDISKLEHALHCAGLEFPWEFYQIGDMKTLKLVSSDAWRSIDFVGVKHCCLDDAKHQAKVIHMMLKEHGNVN